jgi:HEPN domain-containing protein
MTLDHLLNDFAIRSFRDIADADYIVARTAFRARLVSQYLSASQQSVEKYLKCILLLNRIPAREVRHNLGAALGKIISSTTLALSLTESTKKFIDYLDSLGRFRYLDISNYVLWRDIVRLDRTVWELRRYCTLSEVPRSIKLRDGVPPAKVRLDGGVLEKIIDDVKSPAREPLLWQNAFFGKRVRRRVRVGGGFHCTNSPLSVHPEILDEVLKYVLLPKDVVDACRAHAQTMSAGAGSG